MARSCVVGVPTRTLLFGSLLGIIGFSVVPIFGLFPGFVLGVFLAESARLEAYEALTEAILLYETSGYQRVEPEEGAPEDLRFYEKRLTV